MCVTKPALERRSQLESVISMFRPFPTWPANLKDPRRPLDVIHDLASLIRASVWLSALGWRDQDDADALRHDPAFRLAASSAAGLTPLGGPGLASQPSLSRFTALPADPTKLKVLREAVLELTGRGLRAERCGKKIACVTLDVDSAPIEVHGHQPRAEWNGHYNARIYHPLITSIAATDVSHQPFQRRERAMLRFRRKRRLQKFASVHASVFNHFNQERSLSSRTIFKLTEWFSRRSETGDVPDTCLIRKRIAPVWRMLREEVQSQTDGR